MLRVLLVDDEPADRKWVSIHLRKLVKDIKIVEAPTVGEAMIRLAEQEFGLIVLDMTLPDSNSGEEAFERVHAASFGCPIVVASGSENPMLLARVMRMGASNYILKGSDRDRNELASILLEAVQSRPATSPADKRVMKSVREKRADLNRSMSSGDSGQHQIHQSQMALAGAGAELQERTFQLVHEMAGTVRTMAPTLNHLNKVVVLGNGKEPLMTRVARLETEAEQKGSSHDIVPPPQQPPVMSMIPLSKSGNVTPKQLLAFFSTVLAVIGAVVAALANHH